MRMKFRRIISFSVAAITTFLLGSALMAARVQWDQRARLFVRVEDVRPAPIAMIFGASVRTDGTASDALRDRVMTGVSLYQEGKVGELFMTGDDGKFHVDEISSMKKIALDAGVPEAHIRSDGHGYRTYESCKRATETFDVKDAILVTQRFHLGRAAFLCRAFGMNVQGFAADRQRERRIAFFTLRETLASIKAWWDVNVWPPKSPVAY